MRRHLTLMAVALMAIGSLSLVARAADEENNQPSGMHAQPGATTQPSGQQATGGEVRLPAGITISRTQTDSSVRETLANIADTTLTKNDLGKLAKYITQARTSNIGDLSKLSDNQLNGLVDKIHTNWKNKYGKAFNATASAYNASGSNVRILMGEITTPTMLSNWPLPNKNEPGQPQPRGDEAAHAEQALRGTDVAVVVFPAEQNIPEVTASLIKQDGTWKVEIPENINGKQFHDNLVKQLDMFSKSSWPQNQDDAYRLYTHHVLAALYGVQH